MYDSRLKPENALPQVEYFSLASFLWVFYLCFTEIKHYRETVTSQSFDVHSSLRNMDDIPLFLNVTVLEIGCDNLSVELVDFSGSPASPVKSRKYTCSQGQSTDDSFLGCRIEANFYVPPLPGHIRISHHHVTSSSYSVDPSIEPIQEANSVINTSHVHS